MDIKVNRFEHNDILFHFLIQFEISNDIFYAMFPI